VLSPDLDDAYARGCRPEAVELDDELRRRKLESEVVWRRS
jgi:hypothetical protein